MHFSDSQLKTIQKHLDQYGPMACPVCKSTDWTTLSFPGAIVAQQESTVNIFETLQLVQQVCDSCGYVVQFAASKMGVAHEADDGE